MPSAPQNTQKPRKSRFGGSSWGPPHDEPFRAIRQHSTTRGDAPFKRGGTTPVKVRGGSQTPPSCSRLSRAVFRASRQHLMSEKSCQNPAAATHPLQRGEGKFEGEGGFCGTLPPLQGKFLMQLASTVAKVVKETTSKLESQALLRQKGPPDSHSEHMHLQFCRTRGL